MTITFKNITEFEKRVIRELNILSLKIDDMLENMNVLIKNKVDERESQNPSVNNKVPDIIELFPVNDETLTQLENWLTSSEENKAILVRKFFLPLKCIKYKYNKKHIKKMINVLKSHSMFNFNNFLFYFPYLLNKILNVLNLYYYIIVYNRIYIINNII